jgi:uncharacterized membrane protein YGL010W
MKTAQRWLDEYGESHQHPLNEKIHCICIPLIMFSLIALLSLLPLKLVVLNQYPNLNHWGFALVVFASIYYFFLSIPLFAGMISVSALLLFTIDWLTLLPYPLWQTATIIFVGAWIGQFYGHKIEGKKPSFFKDVQFLLIGPLWLLSKLYRRYGITY